MLRDLSMLKQTLLQFSSSDLSSGLWRNRGHCLGENKFCSPQSNFRRGWWPNFSNNNNISKIIIGGRGKWRLVPALLCAPGWIIHYPTRIMKLMMKFTRFTLFDLLFKNANSSICQTDLATTNCLVYTLSCSTILCTGYSALVVMKQLQCVIV